MRPAARRLLPVLAIAAAGGVALRASLRPQGQPGTPQPDEVRWPGGAATGSPGRQQPRDLSTTDPSLQPVRPSDPSPGPAPQTAHSTVDPVREDPMPEPSSTREMPDSAVAPPPAGGSAPGRGDGAPAADTVAPGAGRTSGDGTSPASTRGGTGDGDGTADDGRPPGADAERPTQVPARGWLQVVKRSWAEQKKDNIPLLAAGVAFYAFIALFPALIAAITVYGLLADPQQVTDQVASLAGSLPESSRTLLVEQLQGIAAGSGQALGIGLVVSVAAALFSASGGTQNLMKAVNIAYDEDESRGFLKLRGTALLLTFGAIVFLLVAVAAVAVVPAALQALGLGGLATVLISVGRFVALFLFVMAALAVVYRYAPDRDHPRFAWSSLGAVVATVLWVVGSVGFSLYVSNFGSYGRTYGALAGVVVLLLWLFLTSFIVLLGAEINAEAEKQTEKDTTRGPAMPPGRRDAVAADTRA